MRHPVVSIIGFGFSDLHVSALEEFPSLDKFGEGPQRGDGIFFGNFFRQIVGECSEVCRQLILPAQLYAGDARFRDGFGAYIL